MFTEIIGTKVLYNDAYVGAPVGATLTNAKRSYFENPRVEGFSVYDEKILSEMSLYGLPFIRVKVPNPATDPATAMQQSLVEQQAPLADLADSHGVFTRTVTVNMNYAFEQRSDGRIPVIQKVSIVDPMIIGQSQLIIINTTVAVGQPVLPGLSYDITLPISGAASDIPEPRGVRLRSAVSEEHNPFDPHVTTLANDQIKLDPPALTEPMRGIWLPEVPYTVQRTVRSNADRSRQFTDKLLLSPAQFRALDDQQVQLRLFTRMVLEITYIDPRQAAPELLNQRYDPAFDNIVISRTGASATTLRFSAEAQAQDPADLSMVSVTYTIDGKQWERVVLTEQGEDGHYSASASVPPGTDTVSAFFEAVDTAGNVMVEPHEGFTAGLTVLHLPLVANRIDARGGWPAGRTTVHLPLIND